MSWLVASAELDDLAAIRDGQPALWREVRRFNAPIQLAVAAAHGVVAHVARPDEAALISLAPCQSGSPELHRWVHQITTGVAVRMNPTHTLHAVDNLALSVLAIALGNHAWAMSLGGAPGMVWSALELVAERPEREVIVLGGDQDSSLEVSGVRAFAMVFARDPAPYATTGRTLRLVSVERRPRVISTGRATPHAAAGARAMVAAMRQAPAGNVEYQVPVEDGDGLDDIVVRWAVGA